MRIALATETYFPQVNGVSRTLGRLVDYLVDQGDQVQLLTLRYPDAESDPCPAIERQSVRSLPLPFYREIRLGLTTAAHIARQFSRFRPDIVHIATEGPLGRCALRAARRLGIPVVSSFHTNFPGYLRYYGFGVLEPAAWSYLRRFHNRGRFTFCPSRSIAELLESKRFDGVRIWSRGVECDRFDPLKRSEHVRQDLGLRPGERAIAYVGRLANEKNLDMLLDAFLALPESLRCKLVFVGDGPMRPRLTTRANGSGVVFTGYKRGEELAALYASCDLFVFPSLTDTFGNVILEGMASGLPAIGFDAPGPRDIIRHGETGYIVDRVSVGSLAEGITEALSAPASLAAMRTFARVHAKSQTWDAVNKVVRNSYLEVLGKDEQ